MRVIALPAAPLLLSTRIDIHVDLAHAELPALAAAGIAAALGLHQAVRRRRG
ncbi:hypothetical protein [Kitasatospora sp. NPDC094015]|uniref:hypothetical protein n=1 Tax=Kitasatospora sp. NPDC094015 TaxID=3155205 RepID=UPI00331EA26B